MFAFLVRRLGQSIIVMLVISLLSFSIQDELGDPLRELVGQSVSEEIRNELREELGLNDPFLVQYWRFSEKAVQGDLGTSLFFQAPRIRCHHGQTTCNNRSRNRSNGLDTVILTTCGHICCDTPKSLANQVSHGIEHCRLIHTCFSGQLFF